jgi:UDP-N-acetylglucosamine 2-epimerase (non-hydrolysing)
MDRIKLMMIVGARPNFVKATPLLRQLTEYKNFQVCLIHTGQHYTYELSKLFFKQLGLLEPDINFNVGSESHAKQTADIMIKLEKLMIKNRPDLVIVFGDINSTLATAIVTSKLQIQLVHVEAGLRSFDNSMPEEINRVITDRLSDLLFVSEKSGMTNLLSEGINKQKIFFVGNIMIDSLIYNLNIAKKSNILEKLSLEPKKYAVITLHRPVNVDNQSTILKLLKTIKEINKKIPIIFPCHPRTIKKIINKERLQIIEPLGYLDFLKLQSESKFVLTDSGGIQEETTYLKIPCLTLRNNTERPVTVNIGSNTIVGTNYNQIMKGVEQILNNNYKVGEIPYLWDGETAKRIVNILREKYEN